MMNCETRLGRIAIRVSWARIPARFSPLTFGLSKISKSSLAVLFSLSEAGRRDRRVW